MKLENTSTHAFYRCTLQDKITHFSLFVYPTTYQRHAFAHLKTALVDSLFKRNEAYEL